MTPGECLCATAPEACYGDHGQLLDGGSGGGNGPQEGSCTIQVYDRWIEGLPGKLHIPGARHGYIVFTDVLGAQHFFEGRHVGTKLKAADGFNGDPVLPKDKPGVDRLDGQISGSEVCAWLTILEHDVDVVNSANISYHWWGPNSSSVLRYMLNSLPDRSWFSMPFMIGYGSRLPGIE